LNIHRRLYCSFLILIIMTLSFSAGSLCANAVEKKVAPKSKVIAKKPVKTLSNTFTLIVSNGSKGCLNGKGKILLKKELNTNGKKDVLAFLKENAEVLETGGFVKYINGLKSMYPVPGAQMTEILKAKGVMGVDWFIYLNNKKTLVGASAIYPKKGDVIMFDYHYWNKDEFNLSNN
jgi:hypothetical protein